MPGFEEWTLGLVAVAVIGFFFLKDAPGRIIAWSHERERKANLRIVLKGLRSLMNENCRWGDAVHTDGGHVVITTNNPYARVHWWKASETEEIIKVDLRRLDCLGGVLAFDEGTLEMFIVRMRGADIDALSVDDRSIIARLLTRVRNAPRRAPTRCRIG